MVASERKITLEILHLIQVLDISRSYLELGFCSLFDYLAKGIGYSEGAAQRRISSARLLKQIPQIETDIKSGEISLTQIALAQSAISQQEKSDKSKIPTAQKVAILNKLKHQTTIATKTILQSELPNYDPTPKTLVNTKPGSVSITLTFSKDEWHQIQSFLAKNSHKIPDQKIESLLLRISNQERHQSKQEIFSQNMKRPLRGPKTANIKDNLIANSKAASESTLSAANLSNSIINPPPLRRRPIISDRKLSRYIPKKIRREILTRANNQCEFLSNSQHRCWSRHFLEIDHIKPISLGGNSNPANLRLLCRAHNFLAAKKWGITKIL